MNRTCRTLFSGEADLQGGSHAVEPVADWQTIHPEGHTQEDPDANDVIAVGQLKCGVESRLVLHERSAAQSECARQQHEPREVAVVVVEDRCSEAGQRPETQKDQVEDDRDHRVLDACGALDHQTPASRVQLVASVGDVRTIVGLELTGHTEASFGVVVGHSQARIGEAMIGPIPILPKTMPTHFMPGDCTTKPNRARRQQTPV